MMPQKEELIHFPILGIEIFDIMLATIYIVAAISMIAISLKRNMATITKMVIITASASSCYFAMKKLFYFLGVFEFLHFKTNLFNHPWGIKKLTLYQSIYIFQTNTFSLMATLLLAISLAVVVIHGHPKN